MKPVLTKESDKFLAIIYKEYLTRRKSGISKFQAVTFEKEEMINNDKLSSCLESDIESNIEELHRQHLIEMDLAYDFELTDLGIVYMENRFKNNINEVTDFIAKFIP